MRWTRLLLPPALALASACDPTGPPDEADVTADVQFCKLPSAADAPLTVCAVNVVPPFATIERRVSVEFGSAVPGAKVIIETGDPVIVADTVLLDAAAGQLFTWRDTVELDGSLDPVVAGVRVRGPRVRGVEARNSAQRVDQSAPYVSTAAVIGSALREPGDSVRIAINAVDDARVSSLRVRIGTAPEIVVERTPNTQRFVDTLVVALPRGGWQAPSAAITIEVVDPYGKTGTMSLPALNIRDRTLPVLTVSAPLLESRALVPGDTVRATMTARDRNGIAWIGVRAGPLWTLADSVAFTDTLATREFIFVVPPGAGFVSVRFFTRDVAGNIAYPSEVWISPSIGVEVFDAIRPVVREHDVIGSVMRVIADPQRDAVYVLPAQSTYMRVVSLSTFALTDVIDLPGPYETRALSMALLRSRDTLLLAMFGDSAMLGIVDLTQPTRSVMRRPIALEPGSRVTELAVGAGDRVLALAWSYTTSTRIVRLGLDGSASVRDSTSVDSYSMLDASPAGDHVLISRQSSIAFPGGWRARRWDPTADTLSTPVVLGPDQMVEARPSISADGQRTLIGTALFGANLEPVRTIAIEQMTSDRTSAIAPDGSFALVPRRIFGSSPRTIVAQVRLADGAIVRSFLLPAEIRWLQVLPDQRTVVLSSWSRLYAFEMP